MFRRIRTADFLRHLIVISVMAGCALGIAGTLQLFGQSRQLSLADILIALRSKKAEIEEKNRILAEAVKDRGITFTLTPEIEKELDNTGARTELIAAIRSKAVPVPTNDVKKDAVSASAEPGKDAQPSTVEPPEAKPTPVPQDFAFFRTRAAGFLKNGDLNLAVADLGKALELKPSDPRTLLDRGQAYAKQGKYDLALSDYNKAIEADPKNAGAFYSRGELMERTGKPELAVVDYEKALEMDPVNELARLSSVRLRKSLADAAKAAAQPIAVPVVSAPSPGTIMSVGAMNEYAESLAVPEYSAVNRRMNIFGRVKVEVMLDETGKIVEVKAVDGPGTLRRASEDAVWKSRFRAVTSGNVPVRASGYIVFNFVNQ